MEVKMYKRFSFCEFITIKECKKIFKINYYLDMGDFIHPQGRMDFKKYEYGHTFTMEEVICYMVKKGYHLKG